MNLDKCIGCHTCSVTCKNVWTNRPGTEYVWFNNVETKPGLGYPKQWEDQERWNGGWKLNRRGKLELKAGGRVRKIADDLLQPGPARDRRLLRALDLRLRDADRRAALSSTSPSRGRVPDHRQPLDLKWGPTGTTTSPARRSMPAADPNLRDGVEEHVRLEYEQAFMFYLPRICEHCLNPSCVASCPSGAMYKREEDGIVLVDQEQCRAGACACPAARTRRCTSTGPPARPRSARSATRASRRACRRSARRPASAGSATSGSCSTTPTGSRRPPRCADEQRPARRAARHLPRPGRPRGARAGRRDGIPDDWLEAAQRSPVYALAVAPRWRCRSTPSTGRCRWSGTCRRCRRS